MRWSGQFTFVVIFPDKLIPICMVNAMLTDVLARGGMKVHRFVPSHRTGCVEMMVNSSMNSRGNGRPTLNRFVLDKCHLRMNYDMWFSTFSGSLHSAWGFRRVSTTVEDVFVQNNVCWKLVFGELRNLMWRWWRWFCHLHGNLECRLLSSHVHARQQTPNLFQPGFISTTLWTWSFVELVLCFCCMWATGKACLWMMWSLFFNNSCMADFSLEPGWLCFRNLMLQHGARQQIREKDNSTVQRLTDSRTAYFGCFRVLRKRS